MPLPVGVPTDDWATLVTAVSDGSGTDVRRIDLLGTASSGATATLDGAWSLPAVGRDPLPRGLAADGSTLALVAPRADASATSTTPSRFAIVNLGHDAGAAPRLTRVVSLPGAFDFDALSPDGSILYVVERLPVTSRTATTRCAPSTSQAAGCASRSSPTSPTTPSDVRLADHASSARRNRCSRCTAVRSTRSSMRSSSVDRLARLSRSAGDRLRRRSRRAHRLGADRHHPGGWRRRRERRRSGSRPRSARPSCRVRSQRDSSRLLGRCRAPRIVLAKFGHGQAGRSGRRAVVIPRRRVGLARRPGGIVAIATADLVRRAAGAPPRGSLGDGAVAGRLDGLRAARIGPDRGRLVDRWDAARRRAWRRLRPAARGRRRADAPQLGRATSCRSRPGRARRGSAAAPRRSVPASPRARRRP